MKAYIVTNYDELKRLFKKQNAIQKQKKRRDMLLRWKSTEKQRRLGLFLFIAACLALYVEDGGLTFSIWAIPLSLYMMLWKNKLF